ncbi:MAG: CPBP family intramembrane metalloprotease [Actinomycetales bacterium]|nr:CPBP family intramembrane metalloprotease [Actinomycetales bacterium]
MSAETSRPPVPFVRRHRIVIFFVLAFVLVWAVWWTAVAAATGLIPGLDHFPTNPGFYGLTITALLVAILGEGKAGILDLLKRMIRVTVNPLWLLAGLAVAIALPMAAAGIDALLGRDPQVGVQLPAEQIGFYILAQVFFFWGTEELAWRGFALPRLQARFSALTSALILGVLWGVWHTPLFFLFTQGQSSYPYVAFLIFTVAESVIIAWIYARSRGSVAVAALVHTASDGTLLFSGALAGDDVFFWITTVVHVVAAVVIVLVEGPKHLARGLAAERIAELRA